MKSTSSHHSDPSTPMQTKSSPTSSQAKSSSAQTSKHAVRFIFVGVALTVFNYVVYSLLANLIIKNSDLLWLSTLISTFTTTIVAYFMHSRITWKERTVTRASVYKFFIWNLLLTFPIGPGLTQFFSLFTPLYELAFNICQALHLDFTYTFVQSTGAFVLTTAVTMILNFLLYDKFVFGQSQKSQKSQKSQTFNQQEDKS